MASWLEWSRKGGKVASSAVSRESSLKGAKMGFEYEMEGRIRWRGMMASDGVLGITSGGECAEQIRTVLFLDVHDSAQDSV